MDDDFPPLMGKQGSWADEVATHDVSMLSCDTNVSSEYTDDVPLTPGFTTSPTTPKTSSGFPCTPRDTSFDLMSIGDREGSDLDRMSLFVGGFPAYWEEANIRELFQRFAGLMTVKVVRPSAYYLSSLFCEINLIGISSVQERDRFRVCQVRQPGLCSTSNRGRT